MLAVSGDVGMLAEENAQRLVSIFCEAAMACLGSLREVVAARGGAAAYYARGLTYMRQWPVDTLNEEVARIEAQYPEAQALHKYVVICALAEASSSQSVANLGIPPLAETYHAFLKRVVASPDVQRVPEFLDSPMLQRRVVFLDAFRNAFHDAARRSLCARRATEGPPEKRREGSAASAAGGDAASSAPPRSRLGEAVAAASAKSVVLLDSPAFFEEPAEPPEAEKK